MKSRLSALICTLLATTAIGSTAQAHDTDIYINSTTSTDASAPLVMLSLDLRANTGASACTTDGGTGDPCNFLREESTYTYEDEDNVTHTLSFPAYLSSTGSVSNFELYKAILKYTLDRTRGIKVGLMVSHADGSNCTDLNASGCSNGGYILSGFVPVEPDLRALTEFDTKLAALTEPSGNDAHSYQGREMFFELFRYLTGQRIYNGHNGWKDRGSSNALNMNQTGDPAKPVEWDATIERESNTYYDSPIETASTCVKLYTVNVLFQVSQQDTDSDATIKALRSAGGIGVDTSTDLKYKVPYTDPFARMVRWMHDADLAPNSDAPEAEQFPLGNVATLEDKQNVISYFITKDNNVTTRQYAAAGVGLEPSSSTVPYVMSADPEALANQLKGIFQQILSVSTSFVSPSVAVNVYNRSQVLSDVYIAMFQADKDGRPRWTGNLKKYKMSSGLLSDVDGVNAVNAEDGRIINTALSYWTDPSTLPAANPKLNEITGKDGRSVARGGCGQRIPGFVTGSPGLTNPGGDTTLSSSRKLFTEPAAYTNGASTALMPLEATTETATALFDPVNYFGSPATAVGTCETSDTNAYSACNLIKFARGLNPDDSKRSWLVADPLHSKPLAINYGAINGRDDDNPEIRIVMGTNDGYVRMVRNTDSDSNEEGIEAWAFMPREALNNLATLKLNAEPIATPPTHPISMDGTPAVYIHDVDQDGEIESGDKVHLFIGMRRGGTSYYALDISDPDDPKIRWRISKGASGTDFAELGQTWSTPRVGRMLVDGSNTPIPVLIFGGGYDPNKDTHPPHITDRAIGSDDSQGNAVFIVNADNGALIWKATKGSLGYDTTTMSYRHPDLDDSIPSDVTPVDSDGNGLTDRIYVGDTGGRVWRIDMKCSDPDGVNVDADGVAKPGCGTAAAAKPWTIIPILSVGRHYDGDSRATDRRFFYPPDYVQTSDGSSTSFDAILIGSGDREDPKSTDTTDYFYMFKDYDTATGTLTNNTASGTPRTHADLGDVTDCTPASCPTPPTLAIGWKLKLECLAVETPGDRIPCGEKNLAAAQTIGGATFFTTYIPARGATQCTLGEGSGALYAVAVQDGDPVGFTLGADTSSLGKMDRFTGLQSGGIPAEIVQLGDGGYLRPDLVKGQGKVPSGVKTYWYKSHRR